MKNVLLIGAETPQVEALTRRLHDADARVHAAPGGLYALTMLERHRPDLILTVAELGDMSGVELSTMVQRDVSLPQVPVVLLARNLEEKIMGERQGDFDLILLDDRPLEALAERLGRLIRRGLQSTGETASKLDPMDGRAHEGTLGVLSFAELIQALSETGKTGKLVVESGGAKGSVWLSDGRIHHATFHDEVGEAAFTLLFHKTEDAARVPFRFEPQSPAQLLQEPKTIDQPVRRLLLAAAAGLDENTTTEMVTAGIKEWLRGEEDR